MTATIDYRADPLIDLAAMVDPVEADAVRLLIRLATEGPLTPVAFLAAVTDMLTGESGREARQRAFEAGRERGRRDVYEERCGPRPVPPPPRLSSVAEFERRVAEGTA